MNAVLHLDKVRPKKGECSDYGNEVLLDPTYVKLEIGVGACLILWVVR